MKKLADGIYIHRRVIITRDNQGVGTELNTNLFATYTDARRYIDKYLDGTNKSEPTIIGQWQCTE